MKKTYRVSGLDCAECALKAEEALSSAPGVMEARVDYLGGTLLLSSSLSREEAERLMREAEPECRLHEMEEKARPWEKYMPLIVAGGRALLSLLIALLGLFLLPAENYGAWPFMAMMAGAWLISGADLLYKAVRGILRGKDAFGEALLMSIASLGAFLLPLLSGDYDPAFDAVLVVILYQVGEILGDLATRKSHDAVLKALGMRKAVAHLITEGGTRDIPLEEVRSGDRFLVKLGDSVPADGIVLKGEGEIDLSSLTGEFAPRLAKEGDEVVSSAILKTGNLEVEARKDYRDSTSARILELVEGATREKGRTEKLVDRFSRWYTPLVMVVAVLIAVVPSLALGAGDPMVWARWGQVALSLLVISCPCAIVLAVPLCYFSGVGAMGKGGVLLKGTEYVDALASLGLLATDKTGTLTEGRFSIAEARPIGISEEELLGTIAIAESRSSHPIAKAFHEYLPANSVERIGNYEEIPGNGIHLAMDGKEIYVGTASFLEKKGISAENISSGTNVHLAVDGQYRGCVVLQDAYKAGSKPLFQELSSRNIGSLLLTGDRPEMAEKAGHDLGIGKVMGGLLPEEKAEALREAKLSLPKGKTLGYLGDGINDAASLALADCGIAMGGLGSGLAMESADVLLMEDDPSSLASALRISRKTRGMAYFLLALTLLLKLAIMCASLALGTGFPLWAAVFGDTGLTILTAGLSLIPLSFGTSGKRG